MPGAAAASAEPALKPAEAFIANLCASLRLPADQASSLALAALMGERLPVDPATVRSLRRFLRDNKDDPGAARLAARALAAGLDLDDPALRAAVERLGAGAGGHDGAAPRDGSGADGSGTDSGSTRGGSADDGGADSGAAPRDGSGDGRRNGSGGGRDASPGATQFQGAANMADAGPVLDTADLPDIQTLALQLAEAAGTALADPDLASLSSREPDGSGWVCLPFNITVAGLKFNGFFRIWYYSRNSPATRLVADIRFEGGRRLLELSGHGDGTGMMYCADKESERAAFMAEFGCDGRPGVVASTLIDGDLGELLSSRGVDEGA